MQSATIDEYTAANIGLLYKADAAVNASHVRGVDIYHIYRFRDGKIAESPSRVKG